MTFGADDPLIAERMKVDLAAHARSDRGLSRGERVARAGGRAVSVVLLPLVAVAAAHASVRAVVWVWGRS